MNTSKKSYINEYNASHEPLECLREGLTHYTEAFLDVINQANQVDTPIMIAALINCSKLLKESRYHKDSPPAQALTELMLAFFQPEFEVISTRIPKDILEKFRHAEEAEE